MSLLVTWAWEMRAYADFHHRGARKKHRGLPQGGYEGVGEVCDGDDVSVAEALWHSSARRAWQTGPTPMFHH
jgi:hypothetical protein